jgi:transposase InsO family protein
MTYPLVEELAAEGVRVSTTCRVLGFSPQAFYKWRSRPCSDRDWDDAHLVNEMLDIHHDDPEFGYRFIADELERHGTSASENRVQRLCQAHRIWSTTSKKRGLSRKAGPPVHDDLVDRDFTAERPNHRWVGDITEHPTSEGKLYLCTFKDLWSNRIVGYSIADRMTAALAVAAIRNAGLRRGAAGVTVHTDRGSQFRSRAFVSTLNELAMVGSMGRVGACGDNAPAESFFSLLQKNVLNRQRWATRDDLRIAIIVWIERTYHRRRKQRRLGRLTPIEFETLHQPAAHAA